MHQCSLRVAFPFDRLGDLRAKQLKAFLRDGCEQGLAVGEVAIGCGRTDAGLAGGIGQCETLRAMKSEQFTGCVNQRRPQISVMVAPSFRVPTRRLLRRLTCVHCLELGYCAS